MYKFESLKVEDGLRVEKVCKCTGVSVHLGTEILPVGR